MRRTTTIDQDQGTHDATGLTITKYTEIITELDEREGWSQAQLDDLHAARVALASLPSAVRDYATDWLADEQCEAIDLAATIRRAIEAARPMRRV